MKVKELATAIVRGKFQCNTDNDEIKEIAKQIQLLIPSWINVDEKLPEQGGRYWCYVKELNDGGWFSYFQCNCYFDVEGKCFSEGFEIHNVTHWTNLLPAPNDSL